MSAGQDPHHKNSEDPACMACPFMICGLFDLFFTCFDICFIMLWPTPANLIVLMFQGMRFWMFLWSQSVEPLLRTYEIFKRRSLAM